jgi:hypothetical protein
MNLPEDRQDLERKGLGVALIVEGAGMRKIRGAWYRVKFGMERRTRWARRGRNKG